jgi:hypothetical protein
VTRLSTDGKSINGTATISQINTSVRYDKFDLSAQIDGLIPWASLTKKAASLLEGAVGNVSKTGI